METNEQGLSGFRFYNAGSKLDEQWPFSISASSAGFNPEDGQGAHSLGKFNFVAPREGWVFVPVEIQSGREVLRVNFPDDCKRKFGARGVVMLDPRHDPATEDPDKALESYPVAPTEELCIERAKLLWLQFLERICSAHFDDVQNAMAQGNRPRAASGFTVHALKMQGYTDPAVSYLQGMREGKMGTAPQSGASPELMGVVKGMQEQNKLMMSVILAIASGQKIDPELLKQAVSPDTTEPARPQPAPPTERPVNAGTLEVEGQGTSSLQARINRRDVETVYEQPAARPKSERFKAAAKEL